MLIAVTTLGALTFLIATVLLFAHSKLRVDEDPRIEAVYELLPHTNCGACGLPGCRPFAEALVRGDVEPAQCTVSTDQEKDVIAGLLGVDVGVQEQVVARLACAGGSNVARMHARYEGVNSCRAAALVAGGGKGCAWGCLGLGDCGEVCDFDAIQMDVHNLPVVDEDACTACGDCVDACPKDLFSLHPVSHRLWVACKNLEHGDAILEDCEVGCTACGKCAMDASGGAIAMVDNLAVVDYSRMHAQRAAIERCPTGAIIWFDPQHGPIKGHSAHRVVRQSPRQYAPT
jgi:RnfABCDGE-type electron transport complex B subunit